MSEKVKDIKTILVESLILFIGLLIFIMPIAVAGYVENNYTLNTTVVDIEDNVYTVETKNGNQFKFELAEYEEDKEVKLYMYTNHTDNCRDDIIVKAKFKNGNTYHME